MRSRASSATRHRLVRQQANGTKFGRAVVLARPRIPGGAPRWAACGAPVGGGGRGGRHRILASAIIPAELIGFRSNAVVLWPSDSLVAKWRRKRRPGSRPCGDRTATHRAERTAFPLIASRRPAPNVCHLQSGKFGHLVDVLGQRWHDTAKARRVPRRSIEGAEEVLAAGEERQGDTVITTFSATAGLSIANSIAA
jgi:hypothetical protein